MQLYELEKRLTMDVKFLANLHGIDMKKVYINVQTSKGCFGHYSKNRWIDGEDKRDELALNPEKFQNPLEIVDTMLHELVHVYCDQNNIKDTSRNGFYHNQRFKKIAEEFGLLCIATDNGWNTTSVGNEEALEKINSTLPYPVTSDMIRRSDSRAKRTPQARKPKHVYTCPLCGTEIKHKDLIFLGCIKCKTAMELDTDDTEFKEWKLKLKGALQFAKTPEVSHNGG